MNNEHRKRKMAKVRLYLKGKWGETWRMGLLLICGIIYFSVLGALIFCVIHPLSQWRHLGTDEGDTVVSFCAGIALGVWLLFNTPRFIEWWKEPEPGDEPAPPSIPQSKVIGQFTGTVVQGVPASQTWLEVPMVDTDGEEDTFYVRLYAKGDSGMPIIRNHEGMMVSVTGQVYKPDYFGSEDYDLVLVVTEIGVVGEQGPELLLKAEASK